MGKLHIDLATQDRVIMGGSTIKITLIPHDPTFYMLAEGNDVKPKVEFLDTALYVTRSKVSNLVGSALKLAIKNGTAKYPFTRYETKTFTISPGTTSAHIDNIKHGQMPIKAYCVFVPNTAFTGVLNKNPFNFKHYDINYLCFHMDGDQYPQKPYTPDFANGLFSRTFMGLYDTLSQLSTDSATKISKDEFLNGSTIFAANFAPDMSDGCSRSGHVNPIRKGTLRMELKLASTPETINAILLLEYDSIIEMTNTHEIKVDFS
jgi:hypothetical protein